MTTHRFGGDWRHHKVWVGDLLYTHTGRLRGHGMFYVGKHFRRSRTVEQIRRRISREITVDGVTVDPLLLNVRFFDIADSPEPTPRYATLELMGGEPVLNIPALLGPPQPPFQVWAAVAGG